MKIKCINQTGSSAGEISLNETVFGAEVSEGVIFENVMMQRASLRQGTAKTKERAEVRGGGRKPYKQKGTGNARQGSIRAPNYVGGGTVFGPRVRSYGYKLPKKARRKALISTLSQKQAQGQVTVFDSFELDKPSTKGGLKLLGDRFASYTLVVDHENIALEKSVRNIKRTKFCNVESVNVMDLLRFEHLLISKPALEALQERLAS